MFSIFKKASSEQDVVLQELTEGQLAQVAGGVDKDEHKEWNHRHHHHHHQHHHHHYTQHNNQMITSRTPNAAQSSFNGHW